MRKTSRLETSTPNLWRQVTTTTAEQIGEQLLFALGLERRQEAVIYMQKDSVGDVHVSLVPREGPRKIIYKAPQKERR